MADGLRGKRVMYDFLHNLCSADYMYDDFKTKKRRTVKSIGVYEAERLKAQRKTDMVSLFAACKMELS